MEDTNTGEPTEMENTQAPLENTQNIADGDGQITTNTETFLAPIETEKKLLELKLEFRDFVNNLPRKLKRKVYEEKKFGNTLKAKFHAKRMSGLNK